MSRIANKTPKVLVHRIVSSHNQKRRWSPPERGRFSPKGGAEPAVQGENIFVIGTTTVVFDGYPEDLPEKSTKRVERLRCAKRRTAPDVIFNEFMTVTMSQEFLSNDSNKGMLIAILCVKLESKGFLVKQDTKAKDHLIVVSAIVAAEEHICVVLVGEKISSSSYSINITICKYFFLETRERKLTEQHVLCQQF
ncbi:hypothetical protein AVEN_34511-1 [Araneus ventricosus]|uniref:Uncharacterized protein n=1 Tax=Araneus ventricosus TaxID=182803 RepID=A0A4Y2QFD2_ARAVE|nr:hypothetical protein AVEN_34511-1 [Araneus ventricosus]